MTDAQVERRRRVPLRPPSVDESRMSLAEHLVELRKRLLWSVAAIAVGAIVAFMLWEPILNLMLTPYCKLPQSRPLGASQCQLFNSNVLGEFSIRLKVAMIGGAILTGPFWLYQLWAFIAPGLHRKERRWGIWFISISFILFSSGVVFAYYTLDRGLRFLLSAAGERVENLLDVESYFTFITLMLLGFGVSFEFPLVLVLLNMAGVLSTRRMRSSRRLVAFGIALFAAVITPSGDPFTFFSLAGPMYLFYEGAIVFGRVHDRIKRRRAAEDSLAALADDEMSEIDERPSELDLTPSSLDDIDDDVDRE
jgi:sec-independent protein translocase protein TatC